MNKKNVKKAGAKKNAAKSAPKKHALKAGTGIFRMDSGQTAILKKIGRTSASNAIRASKALDLTITYMEKGVLYREFPDGTKQILPTVLNGSSAEKKATVNLRKGMVLHAKK